jgi:hypothetical protein
VVGLGGELTTSQTGNTFVDVTELVVNGTSTSAKFIALTAASGTGSLDLTGNTWDFGAKADPLLNSKSVTSPATVITGDFAVPTGSTLSLTGATVGPTGGITVNGTISLAGTTALTILADKTLDITGTVVLAGTASVILTTGATPQTPARRSPGPLVLLPSPAPQPAA